MIHWTLNMGHYSPFITKIWSEKLHTINIMFWGLSAHTPLKRKVETRQLTSFEAEWF